MPSILVLGIYFFLTGDGERIGWNRFLYGGSIEDEGNNYGISILTGLIIFRWRHQGGDGVAAME
jgi:hypothetical protein